MQYDNGAIQKLRSLRGGGNLLKNEKQWEKG